MLNKTDVLTTMVDTVNVAFTQRYTLAVVAVVGLTAAMLASLKTSCSRLIRHGQRGGAARSVSQEHLAGCYQASYG